VEDRLYSDPDLAQFYDLDNGCGADLDYCMRLAQGAGSVLDLGCGTGPLLSRLAERCVAVGADRAGAMIEIARQRPGGDRTIWIVADARTLRLDRRFDLIVLTGHAFQVFLTETDQRAVISTIAEHLAPTGRFVFDSRNPAEAEWRGWTPDLTQRSLHHPRLGKIAAWNEASQNEATGIVTYHTYYEVVSTGQRFSAASQIRFTAKDRIAALLDEGGLAVDAWLGDWSGNAYTDASADIIPVGRLR
jgi:SAM-dependent methyltransferase